MHPLEIAGYLIGLSAGWGARIVWVSVVANRQELAWFNRRMKEAADA